MSRPMNKPQPIKTMQRCRRKKFSVSLRPAVQPNRTWRYSRKSGGGPPHSRTLPRIWAGYWCREGPGVGQRSGALEQESRALPKDRWLPIFRAFAPLNRLALIRVVLLRTRCAEPDSDRDVLAIARYGPGHDQPRFHTLSQPVRVRRHLEFFHVVCATVPSEQIG